MPKEVKDYVCFDLETTGFGGNAEIIEIGAVKVRNGEITETFSELVKPTHNISPEITQTTGIAPKDVENCRNISAVLSEFLDFIGDDILVGHNIASFDIPIIRRIAAVEFGRKFNVQYIDTVYLSQKIIDVPDHKLQTMLDYYGIQNARAHRAFEDCEANNKLLQALQADGIEAVIRYSCSSVEPSEINAESSHKDQLEILMCDENLTSVAGKRIVLTGDFEFGSRKAVEAILSSAGAVIRSAVTKKTDYLIVGSLGSDRWRFENGGGKIKTAQEFGVDILPEIALKEILKTNMEVYNG